MPSPFETRRAFLATLGSAIPLLAADKKRAAAPPNILMILVDDLPATMLGCYGNKDLKTPNIDALARRGVRFQSALVSSKASVTGRATLLSGRTSMQHGISADAPGNAANEVLLTDVLSGLGYDVGFVGAWGLGNDKQPGHGIRWSYIQAGDQMLWNGEPVQESGDAPAILTRRALQFLEQQKPGGKPFALIVSYTGSLGIASVDNQVPLLIGKIHERGLDESTMIVFTASGGSPEALRAPLMYCWPGHVPVEAVRPELVGTYDLFPTICDVAGATLPARNLCGRSYLPLVTGKPFPKKHPWKTMVYGSFGNADAASDSRFTLVIHDDGKGANQLIDRRSDGKQTGNQYGNRAFVTTRDQLRRNLTQWKTQYSK